MMQESFNLKCNQLEQDLILLLSNTNLPIGVIYFILKSVYLEIGKLYENQLQQENDKIILEKEDKEKNESIN